MKKLLMIVTIGATASLGVGVLHGQTPGGTPFRIEKLDPALDDIIAPDTKIETLGDHLYTTGGGGGGMIQITSPEGKPLGRLHLPVPAVEPKPRICSTNVAFGDADNRGLYITACTHLFKVRLKTPGIRPGRKG